MLLTRKELQQLCRTHKSKMGGIKCNDKNIIIQQKLEDIGVLQSPKKSSPSPKKQTSPKKSSPNKNIEDLNQKLYGYRAEKAKLLAKQNLTEDDENRLMVIDDDIEFSLEMTGQGVIPISPPGRKTPPKAVPVAPPKKQTSPKKSSPKKQTIYKSVKEYIITLQLLPESIHNMDRKNVTNKEFALFRCDRALVFGHFT